MNGPAAAGTDGIEAVCEGPRPVVEDIAVLFRDESLAVVHKPTGMLVHRGMGADRDEVFLLQAVRERLGTFVHPVHRLDRPTSGLVVFALDSPTAREMQRLWQAGAVRKRYRAVVRGWMPAPDGIHDEALDDPDSGILQEARTAWKEVDRCEVPWPSAGHPSRRLALLELEPLTGRYHQLRRHLSRLAHPVAGDTTHGCRHLNHELETRLGWWRLLLFAEELSFPHPHSGAPMAFRDDPARGALPWWDALRSAVGHG